jgi:predicted membrane channel-forming protein YqfA (hemolysin III family)
MPKFKYENERIKKWTEESKKKGCCYKRGGRLSCFMLWEFFSTVVTISLFFIFVYLLDEDDEISLRGVIYFCKTVYGLLSIPFMIFAIPIMTVFLTKSKATKYDK